MPLWVLYLMRYALLRWSQNRTSLAPFQDTETILDNENGYQILNPKRSMKEQERFRSLFAQASYLQQ